MLLRGAVRSLGVRCHDEFGRCFGSYLRYSRLVSFSYQLPITRLALRLCYLQYYASCSQVGSSRFGWLKFEVSMSFSAKLHSAIFWLYRKDLCIVFRSLSVISSACMVQVWNLAPKLRRYHCFILLLWFLRQYACVDSQFVLMWILALLDAGTCLAWCGFLYSCLAWCGFLFCLTWILHGPFPLALLVVSYRLIIMLVALQQLWKRVCSMRCSSAVVAAIYLLVLYFSDIQ